MSNVSSLTSREPVPACLPEEGAPVGGTGAPPRPSTTSSRTGVEEYRENDARQSQAGKKLEAVYGQALGQMPPGGKMELSGQLMVSLAVAGELKGKVEVERLEEGSYQVTLRGGAGMGLAASTPGGKEGAEAAAMLGGQGAVVLHFDSAAEAADRLAALTQTGTLKAARIPEWLVSAVVDENASLRSAQALRNLRSFEVGLYGDLRAGLDLDIAKVGLRVLDEGTFRVDVRKGTLVYECSLQVQLQGSAKSPSVGDTLAGELGTNLLGGGVESRASFRAEVTLTKEELARIQEGKLESAALLKPERIRKTLTQEVKGELAGASFTARRELPVGSPGDLLRANDPRGEWSVSAGMKVSGGLEAELDLSVAGVKVGMVLEKPLFTQGPRKLTLGEVEGAVHRAQAEAASNEQLLQARLAANRR